MAGDLTTLLPQSSLLTTTTTAIIQSRKAATRLTSTERSLLVPSRPFRLVQSPNIPTDVSPSGTTPREV
ncbi:MAG: hypothetical protein ACLPJH_12325 [Myxococcaceae bacterium]